VLAFVAKFYNEQSSNVLYPSCDDLIEIFYYCNLPLDLGSVRL